MKPLVYVLIAAASCWIVSELLEVILGDRTTLTLVLTAVFHLLISIGIWGAYSGQAGSKTSLSLIGAVMTSVGYLLLVYPPLAVSQTPAVSITDFMDAHLLFKLAGFSAVLGTIVFGISVILKRSFAVWTGVVLIVSPVLFSMTMLSKGPAFIAIVANITESIALITMGLTVLRIRR